MMSMRTTIKTYEELIAIPTFEDRFEYLKLSRRVGEDTFGSMRFVNQSFYHSREWRRVRNEVIVRDQGCDLAHPDYPIYGRIQVHHLNPITLDDIENGSEFLLNPRYLVCVSDRTHNAITYGSSDLIPKPWFPRTPNDTCPWLK